MLLMDQLAAPATRRAVDPPLVVDLDGTLLHTDLLVETGLLLLREQPAQVLRLPHWLTQGKATLKRRLAERTLATLDVGVLPYNAEVLVRLREARARGRTLVLATASDHALAERVATHLGLFDEVLATEPGRNLSGCTKRDVLVQRWGERGFDYMGNAREDLHVWAAARQAIVVDAPADVERRARALGTVAAVIHTDTAPLGAWLKALRLHQWLKNLLLWVPLLAAHRYSEPVLLGQALLAFMCFGLCASSVYLLNDLLDLGDDRHHPRKRLRPFASGRLSVLSGLTVFPLLLLAAFGLALWQLPPRFATGLLTYYGLTLAYSLTLKRRMVIDVITLATLYTLRIIVGGLGLDIPLSFWLLACSMFMFLSLALVKRYAELFQVREKLQQGGDATARARGRGYYADDLGMIASLGASAGYLAVMVLALYINDARTTQLYRHPEIIWLACPLLLTWISRVWMLAHRGLMNEDPVIFAVRDRISLGLGALIALAFWAAI